MLSGENVAVKMIVKKSVLCEEDFQNIACQIQILKSLSHPNILRLLEVIDTPKRIYLVTEYVPNCELRKYVGQQKRLNESEACKYFR